MNKITMYYDHTCPICRTEAYHMRDKHGDKIAIVPVDDGLAELEKFGISRVDAMTYLCVADVDGQIIKGIEAVRLLHTTAGSGFAVLLGLPIVKQVAGFVYPIFARNRYYMPAWLTKMLFGKVADEEVTRCERGVCQIPPAKRETI